MVSTRTWLLVVLIAGTYAVSLTYYVQSYYAYTAETNSVNIYIAIEPPPTPGGNASYSPDVFTVAHGQRVTLIVHNMDTVTHGLAIDNFTVDTGPISANTTAAVVFQATALGTFTYYEPQSECAATGGTCDSLAGPPGNTVDQLAGNMTVIAPKI